VSELLEPCDARELAEALREAAARGRSISLGGNFSKQAMGGPTAPAEVIISTRRLRRVLSYDPRDLTVSVEAGLRFAELSRLLAGYGQMVPLDPCFGEHTTVGGALAANLSGPRRRLYGAPRDMLIGMKLATVEGKIIESGGMVVKNVAGLDVGRLLIGSFGTLAAIVSANFRSFPIPPAWRTYWRSFPELSAALEARDRILKSPLQPAALDLLNPAGAARLGHQGYLLALEAGGSLTVLERYSRELPGWEVMPPEQAEQFWSRVREFAPEHLAAFPEGCVVRVSSTLAGLASVLAAAEGPALARAGSGTVWVCFPDCESAQKWTRFASSRAWQAVIEFAPPERKLQMDLWPAPGDDFGLMQKLKQMFDPHHLLNRGRLYGRI